MVEHAESGEERFTGRYAFDRLVYAEDHPSPADAIAREKQLEGRRRAKKVALINTANPAWRDLRTAAD